MINNNLLSIWVGMPMYKIASSPGLLFWNKNLMFLCSFDCSFRKSYRKFFLTIGHVSKIEFSSKILENWHFNNELNRAKPGNVLDLNLWVFPVILMQKTHFAEFCSRSYGSFTIADSHKILWYGSHVKYTVLAENIRSWNLKYTVFFAVSIRSFGGKYTVCESIRSCD